MTNTSQAFPPDFPHNTNTNQFSKIHEILKENNHDINVDDIYYKPLKHSDEVKELSFLYKEWFPLEYPQEFYDYLLDDETISTILALYDLEINGEKQTFIVGVLMYETRPLDLYLKNSPLLNFLKKYNGIYILSIGVIDELRQKGLATILMNKLLDSVKEDKKVKYLYLDVVEYNKAAIRFYEKIGFERVKTRESYYDIMDKKYDSLVYCLFINEGEIIEYFYKRLLSHVFSHLYLLYDVHIPLDNSSF